jgi:hypothetical protein
LTRLESIGKYVADQIHITVAIQEEASVSSRVLDGTGDARVGYTRIGEESHGDVSLSSDAGLYAGCVGQPTSTVTGLGAHLRGPYEKADGLRYTPSPQDTQRRPLKALGEFVQRFTRGLGRMPGLTLGLATKKIGQGTVGHSPFFRGRKVHHRSPNERTSKSHSRSLKIHRDESQFLSWHQMRQVPGLSILWFDQGEVTLLPQSEE